MKISYNTLIKKRIQSWIIFGVIPVMIIGITTLKSLFFYKQQIIPSLTSYLQPFSDTYIGGQSQINHYNNEETIELAYTLKKYTSQQYNPYAGIEIYSNEIYDFSGYDYIQIKINTTTSKSIIMQLLVHIPDLTNSQKKTTYLFYQKDIPVIFKKNEYLVNIDHFLIPEWWYHANESRLGKAEINDRVRPSKVKYMHLNSSTFHPVDVTDKITITELSLIKSRKKIIATGGIILGSYLLILSIFLSIHYYKQQLISNMQKSVIPYKQIEFENKQDDELKKLLTHIGENYTEPDLNVKLVASHCGIAAVKIPLLIREHFNLTFPQYLNAIRLTEAKRLLINTNIQIIEIAMNVGYNNVSYFNRIFKRIEGVSPAGYRKINKSETNTQQKINITVQTKRSQIR